MIFYFTGTGNSLYAAKLFDKELYSIPQEMKKESRKYTADRIGIACPQKAIGYAVIQEKNPNARYRHPEISLAEIIQSNNQN